VSTEEQVEIKRGDLSAKVSGPAVITALFCLGLAGFVGYLLFEHDARAAKFQDEVRETLQAQKGMMKSMIYVLALPESEKQKLNLSEPQELRDMRRRY